MKQLPKIIRIVEEKPFWVAALWNTGEIRLNDFSDKFQTWMIEGSAAYQIFASEDTFKAVEVSENGTLVWPNILVPVTYGDKMLQVPLELDPLVLYEESQLIHSVSDSHIGDKFRIARENAGLSQAEVANLSGTTRNYISRIENEQSDIQLETLKKIVELGLGATLHIEIRPNEALHETSPIYKKKTK